MDKKLWIGLALVGAVGVGGGTLLVGRAAARPQIEASRPSASVALRVEGMTCPSCGVAVRAALRKLDGVQDAKVAQSEGRAVVQYDPAKVAPEQMVEAVNATGYRASLHGGSAR